jgi:hypothetical protein
MDTQKTSLAIHETQEIPRDMDVDDLIEESSWSKKRILET